METIAETSAEVTPETPQVPPAPPATLSLRGVVFTAAVGLVIAALTLFLFFGVRLLPPVTLTVTLTTASPTPRATAAYCLLPSFDQGYLENPGVSPIVHCVNTGAVATRQDIATGRYAAQCYDQLSKVPCYHPCYTTSGAPKPCPEGAPPPTPKPSSN